MSGASTLCQAPAAEPKVAEGTDDGGGKCLAETTEAPGGVAEEQPTLSMNSDGTAVSDAGAPEKEIKIRSYFRWNPEEEEQLRRAVVKFGRKDWHLMREDPEFDLLSTRTGTMIKNKWYKMMRGERRQEPAQSDRTVCTTRTRSIDTTDGCPPMKFARTSSFPSTPKQTESKLATFSEDTIQFDNSSIPQQPPLIRAAQRLNNALETLREALAIQADANKAVSACMASNDEGEGDEEIVRTALYVARLAQAKAKRARQCVAQARQEHSEALAAEETMDMLPSSEGSHFDAILGISKILQQVGAISCFSSTAANGSKAHQQSLDFRAPMASEAPSFMKQLADLQTASLDTNLSQEIHSFDQNVVDSEASKFLAESELEHQRRMVDEMELSAALEGVECRVDDSHFQHSALSSAIERGHGGGYDQSIWNDLDVLQQAANAHLN